MAASMRNKLKLFFLRATCSTFEVPSLKSSKNIPALWQPIFPFTPGHFVGGTDKVPLSRRTPCDHAMRTLFQGELLSSCATTCAPGVAA